MNILFILADALRPDHLGCYGYSRNTSPTIDKLAKEGVLFKNSIAHSNHTLPGLISFFTGLDPVSHKIYSQGNYKNWDKIWAGYKPPFVVLKEKGYSVLGDQSGQYYPLGHSESGVDKNAFIDVTEAIHKYRNETFFIWHRSEQTHTPYNPKPPYDKAFWPIDLNLSGQTAKKLEIIKSKLIVHRAGLTAKAETKTQDALEVAGYERSVGIVEFTNEEKPFVDSLYDGEIRHFDDEVKSYIELLDKYGKLDETLIVITSDHGEQLLERGAVGHSSISLEGNLYEENIKIPLIMRYPKLLPQDITIDRQVAQIDFIPTLFELMDFEKLENIDGTSLIPVIKGKEISAPEEIYALTQPAGWQKLDDDQRMIWCIRTPRWKLIKYSDPEKEKTEFYELFDLIKDPAESYNVANDNGDVAASLKKKLNKWISR